MANDRSTPTAGPEGYAASPKSPQQFARTTAHTMQQAVFTPLEKFAMNGSDPLFNSLAGAAGGLTSGIITCPLDVIKTKLQAQGGFRAQARQTRQLGDAVYSGMLGTARYIWREEGLRGMYRGLTPIILGYLPTWAVWFTIYGESKEYFGKYSGK
jgi:solute carrier family 25 folate transporter 32